MRILPSLELRDTSGNWLMLNRFYERLAGVFNGRISFGDGVNTDNIDGVWIDIVTPATPNTDFVVVHNLGRIPAGYFVVSKSGSVDIYTSSVASTVTQLTLRGTIASISVRLFIL